MECIGHELFLLLPPNGLMCPNVVVSRLVECTNGNMLPRKIKSWTQRLILIRARSWNEVLWMERILSHDDFSIDRTVTNGRVGKADDLSKKRPSIVGPYEEASEHSPRGRLGRIRLTHFSQSEGSWCLITETIADVGQSLGRFQKCMPPSRNLASCKINFVLIAANR